MFSQIPTKWIRICIRAQISVVMGRDLLASDMSNYETLHFEVCPHQGRKSVAYKMKTVVHELAFINAKG